MKNVKSVVVIAILVGLTFSFMSMASTDQSITVAYYDNYPLIFNDQGEAKGFLIDLMNDFSDQYGYAINFEYNYWADALEKLEKNEVDLLLDIVYTPARESKYDFSKEPLLLNWGKIAVNKRFNVNSILDLEGMTIGYLSNDYYFLSDEGIKEQVQDFQLNVTWKEYKSYSEILQGIDEGGLDAGVMNSFSINGVYDYKSIEEVPINFSASHVLVATDKGENEALLQSFDTYIKEVKSREDSYYYERFNYWFHSIKREPLGIFYDENKNYIIIGALLFLMTIFMSRYKVSQKVKEISKTNKRLEAINASIIYDQELIDIATKEMDATYEETEKTSNRFRHMVTYLAKEMPTQKNHEKTDFLKGLFKQGIDLIDAIDYAAVFYYNGAAYPYITDTLDLKDKSLKETQLEDVFNHTSPMIIQKELTLEISEDADFLENFNESINSKKEKAIITIVHQDQIKAAMVLTKNGTERFKQGDLRIIQSIKNIAESYFVNQAFKKANSKFQKEIVFSLVEMLEIHDHYTKGHSEIVANTAKGFAEHIGLKKQQIDEIYWAALLHDVGKILVDQDILKKEKKLTLSEEEIVRKHSLYGYAALNQSKATAKIAKYVLYHHERYDGEGYPYGLKGKEIPLGSHIIFLADTYDAMGSERSYKSALSEDEIFEEIEKNLGSQYDPDIGREFLEMLRSESSSKKKKSQG